MFLANFATFFRALFADTVATLEKEWRLRFVEYRLQCMYNILYSAAAWTQAVLLTMPWDSANDLLPQRSSARKIAWGTLFPWVALQNYCTEAQKVVTVLSTKEIPNKNRNLQGKTKKKFPHFGALIAPIKGKGGGKRLVNFCLGTENRLALSRATTNNSFYSSTKSFLSLSFPPPPSPHPLNSGEGKKKQSCNHGERESNARWDSLIACLSKQSAANVYARQDQSLFFSPSRLVRGIHYGFVKEPGCRQSLLAASLLFLCPALFPPPTPVLCSIIKLSQGGKEAGRRVAPNSNFFLTKETERNRQKQL